jgi:TM2 domain-containing membrane protein YozV
MKYCSGCGSEMHETAESCPKCGALNATNAKSKHSKTTLALICFFIGSLGIHRFMVGKPGTGILMILTLGGIGIWTLIDFIMILMGKFRDSDGNAIT